MSKSSHPHAPVGLPELDAYHRDLMGRVEAMLLAVRMSDLSGWAARSPT